MIKKISKKRGFTIIESLVAISILVVAVVGTLTAVQSSISSHIYSKDQVIAFYLAQEGFEHIRNLRDQNRLNGLHWLSGVAEDSDDPCSFGNACIVDPLLVYSPTRCSGVGNCPVLRQDNEEGYYGYHASWSPTNFKREITLTSVNENEIAITVEVSWSKGLVQREFRARENLFNW